MGILFSQLRTIKGFKPLVQIRYLTSKLLHACIFIFSVHCTYIYQDRTPFEKQPDKYFCPVYEPPVNKNANATGTRKARKAELQRDEAVGKALPIAIAVGVAALDGLYFYLNSTF
ncbi:hypothetical protein MKX01_003593 [Papaver californicum]|nr:hypothetical protein MKX01_003593 [Papaver californicum]